MEQTVSTQSDVNLDASLAAYGRRARRSQRSKTEILGYTAAAGGLAFAGGDAMGAIIHNTTGFSASRTVSASILYTGFDIDADGNNDASVLFFLQKPLVYGNSSAIYAVGASASGFVATAGVPNPLPNLPNGFSVGPTLASGTFASSGVFFISVTQTGDFLTATGQAGFSSSGYVGMRFNGTTGTAGTQYAWLKLKVEKTTGRLQLTISEWAYDNSGCPIQVGATTGGGSCGGSENNNSVDSPSTPLLSLLGLGAMGLTSYRRRREAGLKRLAEAQGDVAA